MRLCVNEEAIKIIKKLATAGNYEINNSNRDGEESACALHVATAKIN